MLWILALPVLAVIAMLAYVLGYLNGKKVGIGIARREYESWREMRYCGTALLHMKEVANEFGSTRKRTTALRLCDDEGGRRPEEPGGSRPATPRAIGEG